jgi:aminopeptidase YwaD
MKFFAFFLLFFAFTSAAQQIERAKKVISDLAAPSMYGRGYTFDGEHKAAHYIANRFKQIGLQSYDKHKKANYLQPFSIYINTFPKNITFQLLPSKTKLQAGKDFIVAANSKAGEGEAEIYEVDTLLFEQHETAVASFLQVNLQNKMLKYASKYEPKTYNFSKKLLTHWLSAKGFVKLTGKLTMSLSQEAYMPPTFELKDSINGQRTVEMLQNGTKIAFSLHQELLKDYETQNVVASITGKVKPDSMVVFSAHYDHLGTLGKDAIFFGANDNASGISLLIELAEYYKQNPPPYTTVFIAFGAEEVGLLGSKFFVENPLFAIDKIKLLVNLDLVGTGNEGIGVVNATVFPNLFKKLETLNTKNAYFSKIIRRGKAANSDHYFFSEKGIPAFFIYTLGGIQAYHDIDDKAETLPLTKYKELFELLTTWVSSL